MNELELEIFEQTSDYCELRLSDGVTRRSRGLDRNSVDALIGGVEAAYSEDSVAQRVFGATQLRGLGEKLYAFLDGDERWLDQTLADPRGTTLRITAAERMRHLPWELIVRDGLHLTVREPSPLLPVRSSSPLATLGHTITPHNRPLRVLFMATSPEGVEPELSYEAEEAAILAATATTGTELVVEESGTLEGLRFTAESYGAGYFDVLHISGHATVDDGTPKFVVENEVGGAALATADDIARAMAGQWPRLVFVSGCLTGSAPGGGTIPSMSESLVKAGAPVVLGWALPVGDVSATAFAGHLYRDLAAGRPIDRAIVTARQQLHANRSPYWHLLRVYADKSPLTPMVTPSNTAERERVRIRQAASEFLDPQTRISRVASRSEFVGRRRVIQRCLRILKRPLGQEGAAHTLVLQGMGGLGKSTLASRLLERMPTHQRVVWFGGVDLTKFRDVISRIAYPTPEQQVKAIETLADERLDLAVRLRFLLSGPLAHTPCLFVFDDFEQNNLDERDGGHVLSSDMAQILPALLKAIDDSNSSSRVIITSRYRFPVPTGTSIHFDSPVTFTGVEQAKKVANLPNLRPGSPVDSEVKDRAIAAAAGNPRLLDWLDRVVTDTALDVDDLLTAIENEADRFRREDILAGKLLDAQTGDVLKMLAKVNVVELPIPAASVHAIHDHPAVAAHMSRAVALGLLEQGTDPETGEPSYFVSNVLRPLLRPHLTDAEHTEACAAAARSLYQLWIVESAETESTP